MLYIRYTQRDFVEEWIGERRKKKRGYSSLRTTITGGFGGLPLAPSAPLARLA